MTYNEEQLLYFADEGYTFIKNSDFSDAGPTLRVEEGDSIDNYTETLINDYVSVLVARDHRIDKINDYDTSDAVNSFTYNGVEMWLDKMTRIGLMNSTNIQKAAGITESTLWINNMQLTIPVDTVIQLLSALELYALECYNVTASHKYAVSQLRTVEEIEAYDYTTGYPQHLAL